MRLNKGRILMIAASAAWVFAVAVGLALMLEYETAPGSQASPPAFWPQDSRLRPATDRATLVMLAHPHCPCTRASIGELDRVMAQAQGRLTAYVLFLRPPNEAADWEKSDLWQSAASIPGVSVIADDSGAEARRFNAMTSGQTVLYDARGQLLFHGGITASRGHAGDNAGRSAIVSILTTGEVERTETFVFGCPLFDPAAECQGVSDEHKHEPGPARGANPAGH